MRNLIVGRSSAVLVTSVVVSGCSLLTAVAAARALGAAGRGDLAAIIAPFLVLVSVLGGGLPYAVASQRADPVHRIGAIESTGVLMTLVLGGCASLLFIAWSTVFTSTLDFTDCLLVALCLPGALLVAVFLEYERQRGAGTRYNATRLAMGLLSAACTSILMLANATDVALYALAVTAPNVAVVLVATVRRVGVFRLGRLAFNRAAGTTICRSASRAWPSAVTDTLLFRADQVVLVLLVDPAVVGLYAVAATVAESGGLIRHALTAAHFQSLATAEAREVRDLWKGLHVRVLALTIPAYLAIAAAADVGIPLLLGEAFAGSSRLIILLLLAQLALDLHLTAGTVLLAQNRPGLFSRTSSIALVVHVIALIPLVIYFGALGACYASVVGYGCAAVLTYRKTSQLVRDQTRETS